MTGVSDISDHERPAHVAALAGQLYQQVAPLLHHHMRCQSSALLTLGIARGMGIDAKLCFQRNYSERGASSPHYWVEFSDGSVIDNWDGPVRLQVGQ